MANNDVQVRIIYTDKESADKLVKDAGSTGQKAGSNFGKTFATAVGTATGIALFKGITAGVQALKDSFSGTINAAKVQEDAINSLNTALLVTGKLSAQTSKEIQDFASALQQSSRFGDEAILQASGLIQTLADLDTKGLKRATTATADLASALNIDLQSAANIVGKALGGNIGALGRYGVRVKAGANEAQTLANVLSELEKKFGGTALSKIKTFSGAMQQTSNTFGDLLEEVGFFVTKSPVMIGLIKKIGDFFKETIEKVKKFREANSIFAELAKKFYDVGNVLIQYVVKPLETLGNVAKVVMNFFGFAFVKGAQIVISFASSLEEVTGAFSNFYRIGKFAIDAIKTGFQTLGLGALVAVEAILEAMNSFKDMSGPLASVKKAQDDLFDSMSASAEETGKSFTDIFKNAYVSTEPISQAIDSFGELTNQGLEYFSSAFSSSLSNVFGEGFSQEMLMANENFKVFIEEMIATQSEGALAMGEGNKPPIDKIVETSAYATTSIAEMWDKLNISMKTSAKQFQTTANAIGGVVKNGLAKAVSSGIQQIVGNIMAGKNAFQNFGKFVLGVMGDMAIQVGNQLILSGIGVESLKTLGGAAAIAAGAGLVALGSIMKSMGGGGGGGSTSAPSGGTFDPVNTTSTKLEDDIAEPEAIQDKGPRIALTIEGNVFDTDDTRKSIVQFLNDEFSESGANLENASFA